ncbi:lipid A deacylase LpxR family protein [Polaribacter tangerinus]|uniref:lipid A deacylase LpxR family protein n=1 Tax=Polaribacter tangerinus TaxID=1920034 RepID=UPI0030F8C1E0
MTRKKIIEWQLNHQIYTPFKPIVNFVENHDRPFAAYLSANYSTLNIYKNNQSLKTTFQIGVIGPNAFGKELQNFVHTMYGFEEGVGWKYQIKNAAGLNLNFNHHKFLLKNSTNSFDLTWANSSKLGTIKTNLNTGLLARFGLLPLQKIANSIAFNSGLNNDDTNYNTEKESFFFVKPSVKYQFYDATIQGSFLNTKSDVTKELVPLVFHLEIGFLFTVKNFYFGYTYNYNSNKSKGLFHSKGQNYGSISLNYRLK